MAVNPRKSLPPIHITPEDHEALERIVGDLPGEGVAGLLQQELDRAIVGPASRRKTPAVGLDHWIEYADGDSAPRRVKIVLPREADIDAGKVSVLSHVGAGLIGLAEGQTIRWTDPAGKARALTVIHVEPREA